MKLAVSERGFFGEFGGAYIPEMLYPNVRELQERYLEISQEPDFQIELDQLLRDFAGRPTPLFRAQRLSKEYGCEVLLKREDLLHTGSHKINNTLGQILIARRLRKTRIIAETGAGQHGVATATVCALMGISCVVYMGEIDMERQSLNVARMRLLGAEVRSVTSGSRTLKDATNEALRDWIANPHDTHYIIGSVVDSADHERLADCLKGIQGKPTHIIACVGGGSNAMGAFFHFIEDSSVTLIGVEAAGCGVSSGRSAATTALGSPGILHGSRTLFMQSADGQVEEAHSISAGLDYPGIGPQHAHLHNVGRVEYVNVTDDEALQAAKHLAQREGIIPALETAHAMAHLGRIKFKSSDRVVVVISGRGDKDMGTYLKAFAEEIGDDR